MSIATLDWFFLVALLASMVIGAWRGLVYEVLSALSWVVAFVVAQWLAPSAAAYLPMAGASQVVRYGAGFVVVFVAAVFAGGLLAFLMKKLITAVGLRPMDRALGALFGLVRAVVLLLAVTVVVQMTPFKDNADWQASIGARTCQGALALLRPVLPQEFGKYLPS